MDGRERERERGRGGERKARFGRSDGGSGANHQGSKDITHFFFSNFPEFWGEKELWRVFQRYDKVWDVFVSPRRDRRGHRFGFVRFVGVKNPRRLEQELDTIMIGNTKMNVNFPRFENRRSERREGLQLHGGMLREGGTHRRDPEQPVWHDQRDVNSMKHSLQVVHKRNYEQAAPKKTYAQVVNSGQNLTRVTGPARGSGGFRLGGVEEWQGPVVQEVPPWLA